MFRNSGSYVEWAEFIALAYRREAEQFARETASLSRKHLLLKGVGA